MLSKTCYYSVNSISIDFDSSSSGAVEEYYIGEDIGSAIIPSTTFGISTPLSNCS